MQGPLDQENNVFNVKLILSDDAVAAFSKELILFVKFSLVLSDGHVETLLLKVGLLLLTNGGLLQHLWDTEPEHTATGLNTDNKCW